MTKSKHPTLQKIRDSHTWKREYERYLPLSRYIFRPLGFLATWLAIRIGLTSETVSWLSGLAGLVAYICLMSGQERLLLIGIGFLHFFNLLDCMDGSIARTMKTENPYGRYLDSLMGWVDKGFWALIGVMVYRHQELLYWPNPFEKGVIVWLAIGGLTCYFFNLVGYIEGIFDKLIREDWDKLPGEQEPDICKNRATKSRNISSSFVLNIIRRINHNLRVRETHYFLLVFAYWGNVIDLLLGFFLFYYFLHVILMIIIYCNRGRRIRPKYHA